MALPISAFIITRNEERRLPATLAVLKGLVSEIVIVDSGSTDATVEIAEAMGARVFHRNWTGYGPQKRFAEAACKHDWVINVDADEVITPGLADEIHGLFEDRNLPSPSAYAVRILNIYPGDKRPRPLANDYNVVRFYHRSVASYSDHPVHDRVKLHEGVTCSQLCEPIYHFPYLSLEHVIDKNNRFSTFRAATSKPRSRTALTLRLIFEFPITFIKFYILRLHFTGGWKGFYFSLCHAFMRTSRIAKMLERASEVNTKAAYQEIVVNGPQTSSLQNQFR